MYSETSTGLNTSMDAETKRSELKRLILKGKEQGFLTHGEISDHLPEGMYRSDQIESVVKLLNGIGIEVFEDPPDPDTQLVQPESSDEEVAEEAEAVLTTAVENEFGRTRDPTDVYLREMGQVSLLTREGEVEIDGQMVALADLLAATRDQRQFVKLGPGRFARI
ncbi:MAG: hypothetical protein IH802_12155, partial [Nitrospinae bacterium]|nr:hypothetical protein [Nitrospinota bacterium]